MAKIDLFASIGGNSDFIERVKSPSPEEIRTEWLLQRRGKFTASEFHRLLAYPAKNELPAGAKTYCLEKAVEMLTEMDESESFVSYDMQWGIKNELGAIKAFSEATGHIVTNAGHEQNFIMLGDDVGCTPDGLIGLRSAVEVKCPKSKTHFKYKMIRCAAELKVECPDYYWQIMGSLYVTGRDSWYFISFDPRYHDPKHQLHYFLIERNEYDIAFLNERIFMAIVYRNYLLKEFRGY